MESQAGVEYLKDFSPEELGKSYNSKYRMVLSEKHRQIIEAVRNSPIPITPMEIASITNLPHNSVRVWVKELERKGYVVAKFYGHYVSSQNGLTLDSSTVGDGRVRVHCLRLKILRCGVFSSLWVREVGGVARISFQVFGDRSGLVQVDCLGSCSFDAVGLRLVVDVVARELRVSCDDVWGSTVLSYELNSDFKGVRLDGVQAVTLRAFDGAFFRAYNKGEVLRGEVKATRPLQLENVLALMNGGVSAYNQMQLLFMNVQKMNEEIEAQKFTNRLLSDILAQNQSLLKVMMAKHIDGGVYGGP